MSPANPSALVSIYAWTEQIAPCNGVCHALHCERHVVITIYGTHASVWQLDCGVFRANGDVVSRNNAAEILMSARRRGVCVDRWRSSM